MAPLPGGRVVIEAAAIAGAASTLGAVIAIVVLALYLRDSLTSERASLAAETLATQARFAAEFQRDGAIAAAARADTEAKAARDELAKANAENTKLLAQANAVIGKEIDNAATDDLVSLSHGVLSPQQAAVPGGGGSPAADHPAEAGAVHGPGSASER